MSHTGQAGRMARMITSHKQPRWFWNVFWSAVLLMILYVVTVCILQLASDHICNQYEQVYLTYQDGKLTTDVAEYALDHQNAVLNQIAEHAIRGENIHLTVSRLSGKIICITQKNNTLYQASVSSVAAVVSFAIVLMPMLGLTVFMLAVTNIKNPGKRIDRIQKRFLLRYYK